MGDTLDALTVAVAQIDSKIANKQRNLAKIEEMVWRSKNGYSSDLVLFPECAVTGYCYFSREEVAAVAEPVTGPSVSRLRSMARDAGIRLIAGTIIREGDSLFNAVCYCGKNGEFHVYRKSHLPFMALDKHVDKGDSLHVFASDFGKFGMMVCYELRFPEVARELALQGARIIFQPTNLPCGGEAHPDFFTRARACENRMFLVSCNRVGDECGFHFLGRSQIIDISGKVLEEMGEEEGIICRTLDLATAENKNIVVIPDEYETHIFSDRRPELYGSIAREPVMA